MNEHRGMDLAEENASRKRTKPFHGEDPVAASWKEVSGCAVLRRRTDATQENASRKRSDPFHVENPAAVMKERYGTGTRTWPPDRPSEASLPFSAALHR